MTTAPPTPDPPFVRPMLWALAVLAVISLAYGFRTAARDSADLERRVIEARRFRERSDPYAVPDATYPPTALPVFAALVPDWGWPTRVVWAAENLVALVLVWGFAFAWGKRWPGWAIVAFVLVATACKPTRAGIGLGQFHLIPLAAILASEVFSTRHPRLSGVLAGLALTKPTMSLPYLFVLVAKRRWMALSFAALTQAVLLGIASAWLKIGPVALTREWLANARSQLAEGTIDLPSLIGRAIPGARPFTPLATVFVLLATGALIFAWRNRSTLGLTALATFSAAVMTYHRHYDLVLLLPTLAYLIDAGVRRRRRVAGWAAVVLGAALIVPSDGNIVGQMTERAYEIGFVILAYTSLTILLIELASEPEGDTDGPGLA